MRVPMPKELEIVLEVFNEGKVEKALQLLINLEKLEVGDLEEKHFYRFMKSAIYFNMGRLQESLEIAEQDYRESKTQNNPLFIIDALFIKWGTLYVLGRFHEIWEDVVFYDKLLKSKPLEPPLSVRMREGFILYMKGYFNYLEHNYDKATKQLKKSLAIFEGYDFTKQMLTGNLNILGISYAEKGELDLALASHKKSLDLSMGNSLITHMLNGSSFHNIGEIYFQKGALDKAIEYYKKGVRILDQYSLFPAIAWVGFNYDGLIRAFLYKNSLEEAKAYLQRFSDYLERHKISKNYSLYILSKTRTLRSSSRVRDRAEAEKSLRGLIEGHKVAKEQLIHGVPEEFVEALIEICDFYFEELRLTNDLKIVDDIQPYIKRLLEESERTKSYTLQAQIYLLQGKISLLSMNMGDARRYLTLAQNIAENHGFQLLAQEISGEHDKLLDQMDKWEEFKKFNAPLSDRMALASLNESVELIQRRRVINVPELVYEEPVFLLIMGEGGILLFSYQFTDEVKVDDEIFGGFLSAITSFSDEVFSEGLDRAKFGTYTVLMKNIAEFSFSYVLKGQTYLAKKKLSDFVENFQKNTSMMQILEKSSQTSQVIEIKDFPFLEGFIKGIFTNK
jgi:tetratricopeptide (TPR) repeat protein